MGYYEDLRKKQKESGVYQTRDGGVVKTAPKPSGGSGANIVSGASADLGAGKVSPSRPGVEVTQSERAAAYSTPSAPKITTPTITTPKKNPNTGAAPKYDAAAAVKAATDSAAKQRQSGKLLTRDNYTVNYNPYLDDEDETGTTDITSDRSSAYIMPTGKYQLPEGDPGINYDTINMLLNRYGMQPINGKIGGVPVEALYLGNNRYALPYLLDNPDSEQMYSNGNLITVGDYKKALINGFLKSGNEAAYNNWIAGVAQNPNVKTLSAYEYEDPAAYEESGESDAYRDYIDAAIQAILGQKSGIDQEAAAAKQLAYENYMRTKLGLGEQTSGMATGTADSLMMQNDLTLQNSLNDIDQDRLNAYADIDSQAAQMEAEGNLQLAQMAEERRREAEERAMREREWAYQLEHDKRNGGGTTETQYTPSELSKMYADGVISLEEYRELSGMGGSAPVKMTARGYVDSNYGRSDFANLTLENIKKELNELKKSGAMTTEEYNKALEYYQGLRSLEDL